MQEHAMPQPQDKTPTITETEKRLAQQEAAGRTVARPADASGLVSGSQPGDTSATTGTEGGVGSLGLRGISTGEGTSGMSGAPTNDALPGGGMTGDREQRDIPKHDTD
jgi:hypothetical protein